MQVANVMTRDPIVMAPDASVADAAKRMREADTGFIPVCDGETIVGTITDRDIAVRAVAAERDPGSTKVRDVMSQEAVWCFDDDDTERAAQLMADKKLRRLPVISHDKKLVGVISLGDLAERTQERRTAGETLEKVAKPTERARTL